MDLSAPLEANKELKELLENIWFSNGGFIDPILEDRLIPALLAWQRKAVMVEREKWQNKMIIIDANKFKLKNNGAKDE